MSLTPQRILTITQGFITFLQIRRQLPHPPHNPTPREIQRVHFWYAIFSITPSAQAHLTERLQRRRRTGPRRLERQYEDPGPLLESLDQSINQHEDPALQNLALSLVPESVYDTLAAHLSSPTTQSHYALLHPIDSNDALALSLLEWFKSDFMKWVDPIQCRECGGKSEIKGTARGEERTREEKEGDAGVVELWGCVGEDDRRGCGAIRRFPRYGSLSTLLTTREGRCGEFASLFHLFLLSLSLPSRYVYNTEDHVWNSYYSTSQQRWIHLDPSEGAFDQPLLYEKGWGKKMSYCFALGKDGMRDVTRGYVEDWKGCLERRNRWKEEDLQSALQRITNRRRSNLPSSTLSALAARDQSELLDLHDLSSRQLRAATRQDKLSGRTSGTKDWRIARQEAGKATEREEEPVPVDTSHSTSLFSLTSDSDRIALTGSAEKSSFGISLTRCTTSQTGWAAIKLPLSLPRPNTLLFDLTFRMRKSDPNSDGADGMALVLMKGDRMNHVKGKSGFGLGYDGLGEKGDFAIELDTYQSRDHANDPPTPHISLHSPPLAHHSHSLCCTPPDSIPQLSDGVARKLRVEVCFKKGEVRCWFSVGARDDTFQASDTGMEGTSSSDTQEEWIHLFHKVMPDKLESWNVMNEMTVVLSASTGGLAQAHEILGFEVKIL